MQDSPNPKDCPDCGHAVSVHAATCPSCGATLVSSFLGIDLLRPEPLKVAGAVAAGLAILGFFNLTGRLDTWTLWGGLFLLAGVVVLRSRSRQVAALDHAPPGDGPALRYGLNLTECQECGHAVSLRAAACPSCGVPPPRSKTRQRALAVMFAGLGLYAFGYFFGFYAGLGYAGTLAVDFVGILLFLVGAFLAES